MEKSLFWMIPVSSLLALLLAWHFYRRMMKENEGTPVMRKIASHVRQGRARKRRPLLWVPRTLVGETKEERHGRQPWKGMRYTLAPG